MAVAIPTTDLGLVYAQGINGVAVDMKLTPGNDWAVLQDADKLEQDIVRWVLNRVGANPADPNWGNDVWDIAGRPGTSPQDVAAMLNQSAQAYIAQQQAYAAATGSVSTDEQLEDLTVDVLPGDVPGLLFITFGVLTRAGTSTTSIVPLFLTLTP